MNQNLLNKTKAVKEASRKMMKFSTEQKNQALIFIADELDKNRNIIIL